MALLNEVKEMTPLPPPPRRFRYHVLFSYAGEDGKYVTAVHHALPEEVKVFNYAEGEMWGERLAKGIERRYKNEAPFCVVFISEAYLAKDWTKKELSIVKSVSDKKPGYMLPVMRSGHVPPEIKEIVWLTKTLSADEVAARIVAKLRNPPPARWWFFITTTEVKVAAAVLLLAVVLWFWPSRTTLKSADANAEGIIAHVVNVSPKSSTLVGQRLKFGSLPIEDVDLRLGKSGSPTIFPGEHDVKLTVFELLTKCVDGVRPGEHKVEPLLGKQTVTLEIDILESDDAPGKSRRKTVTFPAAHLEPLVKRLVEGDDALCN